ncbi:MAG TPA: 3-phosphoserine/phosphohydroxythreonine transaminase [Candidatus Babeliaceae bacterium]|nr:3-phosphoserine/phosphohydroxythreonine transaminase [Candidatus Babeliaceae bacterium]
MNTHRKLNFSAGPSVLPEEVLQQASDAIVDYNNGGLSILEISHRGKEFAAILEESKLLVKELCELNDDYELLWQHGGGRLQFCMIPMNFLGPVDLAGYIDSDHWAEEAMGYAAHYGNVQVLASSKANGYTHLPHWPADIPKHLAYVHCTTNNTIYGTQLNEIPKCDVPLIADMSSDIFCSKRDYTRCAMFYAAAQKNFGPAGVALAAIRKDMLGRIKRDLPPMLNYAANVKENSILNTANVFAIYTCLLMLRWIKAKGIEAIEKDNRIKAQLLYKEIERNSLFEPVVKNKADRSIMNVCFAAINQEDESTFITFCDQNNITGIKGHRFTGGFRVSLYNAVTINSVETLINLMKEFEETVIRKRA